MRTTLTLDDDVAAKLRAEARSTGESFKEVVNRCLRIGLHTKRPVPGRGRFRVQVRDLGGLRPGLSLDNVSELLEVVEGPLHR